MKTCDILLVDDNENDVELALRAFKKNTVNGDIMVFMNGDDVLDYVFAKGSYAARDSRELPKLMLLDIKMPLANGFEVLRIIKTNPITRVMPVIMLSSSNQESDIRQCYALGANSYIVKTVDFNAFSDQVKHIGEYWLKYNTIPKAVVEK